MIPIELKIFSHIYEFGRILTLILSAAWFFYALLLMIRLNRRFWLWLLIWPCIIGPMQIGFTWCGFHYRMELYDRYARTPQGWHNINVMPPEPRAEYAKHDYHPRARDVYGGIAGCIVMLPFLYLCGGIGWFLTCAVRENLIKRAEDESKENP